MKCANFGMKIYQHFEMRDKSVMYCRYCNSSDWIPSTPSEFAEIDKILKDMGY